MNELTPKMAKTRDEYLTGELISSALHWGILMMSEHATHGRLSEAQADLYHAVYSLIMHHA